MKDQPAVPRRCSRRRRLSDSSANSTRHLEGEEDRNRARLEGAERCLALGVPIAPSRAVGWPSLVTTDKRVVRQWLEGEYRTKNLSVVVGPSTGLVAVEVFPHGRERWQQWQEGGHSLPVTLTFSSQTRDVYVWRGNDEVSAMNPRAFTVTGLRLLGCRQSEQVPAPGSDLGEHGEVSFAHEVGPVAIPMWLARSFVSRTRPRTSHKLTRTRISPKRL